VPAGSTRGFWAAADWIYCTDGKYRPVEPGSFPLAHGAPARMGLLRGYGNAIVSEAAAAFISADLSI
jgi:DNA (cytosine-5)-methyltransferase 1